MNEYFKIKKKHLYLICIVILVIAAIVTVTVLVVNNNSKPELPVYEMKLFDDDWNEVEMLKRSDGDYTIDYDVKYDGTIKGLNAICYMDGEEIYRYEYKKGFVQNNMVAVWSQFNGAGGWGITDFPSSWGNYRITYAFERGLGSGGMIYTTSVGKIYSDDLPKTMYRVNMIIRTR